MDNRLEEQFDYLLELVDDITNLITDSEADFVLTEINNAQLQLSRIYFTLKSESKIFKDMRDTKQLMKSPKPNDKSTEKESTSYIG